MEWKVGDTVQLKSGGPVMTINKIINTHIHCSWFDGKNVLNHGVFDPNALQKGGGAVGF
jgi:uncharacterized protein YodC (DUF2158 family)